MKKSTKKYTGRDGIPSHVKKAKEVSKLYEEIMYCCEVLKRINDPAKVPSSVYSGGWRVWSGTLENAGIDMGAVYGFISYLIKNRKQHLECKLLEINM